MKSNSIKKENLKWSDAGVWICTKCFKGTDTAEVLKTDFKSRMKDAGYGKNIRVMTSSCLGICPPDAQAILIAPTKGPEEAFSFDPKKDKSEIYDQLLTYLDKSQV